MGILMYNNCINYLWIPDCFYL